MSDCWCKCSVVVVHLRVDSLALECEDQHPVFVCRTKKKLESAAVSSFGRILSLLCQHIDCGITPACYLNREPRHILLELLSTLISAKFISSTPTFACHHKRNQGSNYLT